MLEIRRYKRHFALYEGDTLIAVCLYKLGAEAVKARIETLERRLNEQPRQPSDPPVRDTSSVGP